MTRPTPFDHLGRELDAAAERQVATTAADVGTRRRRWGGRTLGATVVAVAAGVSAAAWAASSVLAPGAPVPFARGAPIAGRAQGAPIPGSVRLLVDNIADPDGGPPWALRYWETDRRFACIQVGRLSGGQLGQITHDRVFHELRLGVALGELGGCFAMDGAGHAFVALHTDALNGAQPQPCPTVTLGRTVPGPHGVVVRCAKPDRTVDFGLLGPNAQSLTSRHAGEDHTAEALGGVGGYLVVQRHVKPVIREYGFHHRDPKLNLHGPAEPYIAETPGSQVIRRVTYTAGRCRVKITTKPLGSCYSDAGYIPIPQPEASDVRAAIRAFAAPDHRGIRVRFRARQAVVDGRSGYDIEIRPARGHGSMSQTYSRNINAGRLVRITIGLYDHRRGPYRVVVRYRTIRPRPGPFAALAYPGLLVGQQSVTVP